MIWYVVMVALCSLYGVVMGDGGGCYLELFIVTNSGDMQRRYRV